MRQSSKWAIAIASVLLASCASMGTGGVAGTLFFGSVGNSMDESDKQKAIASIRSGTDARWTNSTSGNQYAFANTRTFTGDLGLCRDYVLTGTVRGVTDKANGTACRGTNADWVTRR